MAKRLFLLIVFIAVCVFTTLTFSRDARYSIPVKSPVQVKGLACLGELIHDTKDDANILVFGSSRVRQTFSNIELSNLASSTSGKPILVQTLGLPGPNTALSLQFLKEYLSIHQPPEIIYVEAPRLKKNKTAIPYLNPAAVNVSSWRFMSGFLGGSGQVSPLVGSSDFFKILVAKTDQNLTKAVSRKFSWKPEYEGFCTRTTLASISNSMKKDLQSRSPKQSQNVLNRLLSAEKKRLLDDIKTAKEYRKISHSKRQENKRNRHVKKIGPDWKNAPPPNWKFESQHGKFQIKYAKEMVRIAKESNIEIVFIRPYSLRDTEIPPAQLDAYAGLVGADTITIPYDMVKLSYPFYRDVEHPGPRTKRLQSLWLVRDYFSRMERISTDPAL